MKKNTHTHTLDTVISDFEILNENINLCKNLEEIIIELNKFEKCVHKYAYLKNNRPQKMLKALHVYALQNANIRENKVKKEVKKLTKKTYKDYIKLFKNLRNNGASYQAISEYAEKELNIKVSRETIRKEVKNEQL